MEKKFAMWRNFSFLYCFDGAETTDLVGLFLLHQLQHLPVDLSLYRDDGLAVSALTNRLTEKLWQQIKKVWTTGSR